MKASLLLSILVTSVTSFTPSNPRVDVTKPEFGGDGAVAKDRRYVLKIGSLMIATALGLDGHAATAAEDKVYSSNARNMMRLSSGDSSGGSIYDNNPTSPKARRRRAMVGCKNSNARSLAGKMIGQKNLNEKDCNTMVMEGDGTFMLEALTELDCPTCPYGIASR